MDIVTRLRQGIDPDNSVETEQVMDAAADRIARLRAENERLRAALKEIVGCTHRPNPTDQSRIDVAPGQHRRFQRAIEDARALEQRADTGEQK